MPSNLTAPNYQLVCGMEIHAELATESKMFCGCKNDPFGAEKPNIYTCPVCLGLPGALPVANKRAIEWTIQLGLALHCKINLFSKFDRKHYFYPDLPKAYQISQYDLPFCENGYLDTEEGRVRIRRIHLEEDTGKLQHKTVDGEKVSLVDFNRSSVPLVEIVTEPDIHTAVQAKAYAKAIRQLLRFLKIANCDMEQGGMRLEANISLTTDPTILPDYKVELKNINSFRFMEQAIAYETERQTEILVSGDTPDQETRGWDMNKQETYTQRTKEAAEDYRYFPDPDLPPIEFTQAAIADLQKDLPELPDAISKRWQETYTIEPKYLTYFLESQEAVAWGDELFSLAKTEKIEPNLVANMLVNKKVSADQQTPAATVIANIKAETAVSAVDTDTLNVAFEELKTQFPDEWQRLQAGETKLTGFFIGQFKRKLGANIELETIISLLS